VVIPIRRDALPQQVKSFVWFGVISAISGPLGASVLVLQQADTPKPLLGPGADLPIDHLGTVFL
jgi:hypothetical protein